MKAKILTTTPIRKEWLDEVKEHIPDIEFEIIETKEKMQTWYNSYTKTFYGVFAHLRQIVNAPTGYRYRVYVMTQTEKDKNKMDDHWAAYDNVDRDGVLDFYLAIPNRKLPRTTRNGFRSDFAYLFIHEALHGKEQEIGREYLALNNPDRTHQYSDEGRLKELIATHFTIKELTVKVAMLNVILGLRKTLDDLLSKKKV